MTKATTRNHQCQLLALFLVVLGASLPSSEAFMTTVQGPFSTGTTSSIARNTARFMAKKRSKTRGGKGFGEAPTATDSISNNKSQQASSEDEPFQTPIATKPQPKDQTGTQAAPASMSPVAQSSSSSSSQENDLSQGKAALEKMRRKRAEEKDAELRKVKEVRDMDKMLQSSPDAAAIPEKVAMRMGKRMLPFVGIPLFGSMGVFVLFWYLATYKNMEFQPGLVATTTIVILLSGLLVSSTTTSNM
jgi:hypothetical protein